MVIHRLELSYIVNLVFLLYKRVQVHKGGFYFFSHYFMLFMHIPLHPPTHTMSTCNNSHMHENLTSLVFPHHFSIIPPKIVFHYVN
uniref:Uncharacterized protein n=1 Tax=Rhizophora mucronata TaxID=61149 RepID=A0A2P2N961_RHIMU